VEEQDLKHSARLFIGAAALALAVPFAAMADDVSDGAAAFGAKCAVCHNADSADRKIGPGLAGIKDGKLPSGKEATTENILTIINQGGNGMPAYESILTAEEKTALVAYLKTL
jgi:mono/diheme cytochrome c family protein